LYEKCAKKKAAAWGEAGVIISKRDFFFEIRAMNRRNENKNKKSEQHKCTFQSWS
jgi:hypothetical protein